jgi:hypothetical protein
LLTPYFFPTLTGLYVSRFLTGTTFIFFMVSLQNLAASVGGPEKRTANLTTFSLGQAIAGLLGPVIVGVAIDHTGHENSYLLLGGLAFLPLLTLGVFRKHVPGAPKKKKEKDADARLSDLARIPQLRTALMGGAMVFAAADLLNFYIPIYGHSIGLSASMIGIIIGAHSAAAFVVRLVMPKLLKLATEAQLMNYCLLASGAIYFLLDPCRHLVSARVVAGLRQSAVDDPDLRLVTPGTHRRGPGTAHVAQQSHPDRRAVALRLPRQHAGADGRLLEQRSPAPCRRPHRRQIHRQGLQPRVVTQGWSQGCNPGLEAKGELLTEVVDQSAVMHPCCGIQCVRANIVGTDEMPDLRASLDERIGDEAAVTMLRHRLGTHEADPARLPQSDQTIECCAEAGCAHVIGETPECRIRQADVG